MKKKKYSKTKDARNLIRLSSVLLIALSILLSTVQAEDQNDLRLTMMKIEEQSSTIPGFQTASFADDIIEEMSMIDGVSEVVPVIRQMVGMAMPQRPTGDSSSPPPDMNGEPPYNTQDGQFEKPMGIMDGCIIEGVQTSMLAQYTSYELPSTIVAGHTLTEDDSSGIYIGEGAKEYFNVSLGEKAEIEGIEFTVIGIFSDEEYNRFAFMDIDEARETFDIDQDKVNSLYVYVDDAESLESVSDTMVQAFPEFTTQQTDDPFSRPAPSDIKTNRGEMVPLEHETPALGVGGIILATFSVLICLFFIKRKEVR